MTKAKINFKYGKDDYEQGLCDMARYETETTITGEHYDNPIIEAMAMAVEFPYISHTSNGGKEYEQKAKEFFDRILTGAFVDVDATNKPIRLFLNVNKTQDYYTGLFKYRAQPTNKRVPAYYIYATIEFTKEVNITDEVFSQYTSTKLKQN